MNVGVMLANMTTRYRQRLAVEEGERSLTYDDLNRRSNQLANLLLRDLSLRVGQRVAVLCHNRMEVAELMYGVAKAGGTYVALNFRLSIQDLEQILDNAQPSVIVSEPEFSGLADKLAKSRNIPVVFLDAPSGDAYQRLLDAHSDQAPPGLYDLDGERDFWVAYTSGTTGTPKGLLFSHRAVLVNAVMWALEYGFNQSTKNLICVPHYTASQAAILPTHTVGGSVRFFDNRKFSGSTFNDLVDQYEITDTHLVPTQLYRILDELSASDSDLLSVRTFSYGAAPIAPSRLADLVDRLGPRFQQLYGMFEAGGIATQLRKEDHEIAAAGRPHIFGSVGKCSFHVAVKVVDEAGKELPPGVPGELFLRSNYAMTGYNGQPELTAEVVQDGWIHSGDIGYFDEEGYLYVSGRIKDVVIRGGQNIAPKPVEDILHAHESVSEASVVGLPDSEWGEVMAAAVVLREGASADESELLVWCREQGLSSISVPTRILFTSSLPKNLMGKIDKAIVRDMIVAAAVN